MKKQIINFWYNEDGQTSTEYILLLAVVAMIALKFKDMLSPQLTKILDGLFGKINASFAE
mgnify:CR=1 FL=1|tara:strand:- start:1438 stop:1617 length:180 start_codon:yes stop_codon:yes gene_type:complete